MILRHKILHYLHVNRGATGPVAPYGCGALKPKLIERQVSGALRLRSGQTLFFRCLSPQHRDEFGKKAQRSVDAFGEEFGLPFLMLRFLWAGKENEEDEK